MEAEKVPSVKIRYLGGGRYNVSVGAADYKEAEPLLKEAIDKATEIVGKNKGSSIEFKRH
jgi:translation initiation factor 2 alpha subunit (eIF-2alpha)